MDMWDTLGKCIAVALATLLLASIPEMLLLGSNKATEVVAEVEGCYAWNDPLGF